MNYDDFIDVQRRRGRAGGLAKARNRRASLAAEAARQRALDIQWPRCYGCGSRRHLGICPTCDS